MNQLAKLSLWPLLANVGSGDPSPAPRDLEFMKQSWRRPVLLLAQNFGQCYEGFAYVGVFQSGFTKIIERLVKTRFSARSVAASPFCLDCDEIAGGSRDGVGQIRAQKIGALGFLEKLQDFFQRVARRMVYAGDVAAYLALRNFRALANACLRQPILFEKRLQRVGEM